MRQPFPNVRRIDVSPEDYLKDAGRVFEVFDARTQDSGNASYGVDVCGQCYFVKTAGLVEDSKPFLNHASRVNSLRNAVRVAESSDHPALPNLGQVIESPDGPILFYEWIEGKLVRNSLQRVHNLPVSDVVALLSQVYDLHVELVRRGWIANDFYDGSMIYDFESGEFHAVDLDTYQSGPFINRMGRTFGSKRFMAPEEFSLYSEIDERTTVFTMGRTAAVLLSDNSLDRAAFRGSDGLYEVMLRACRDAPDERFQSVSELYSAWLEADSASS